MFSFKILLVVTLSFQLPTDLLALSTTQTEDAQNALTSLYSQIQSSSKLVSTTAPNLWNDYKANISEVASELLRNETAKFNIILKNLTFFANTVDGGSECIDYLLDVVTGIGKYTESEDLIFLNLLNLANVEISRSTNQYDELNSYFVANCLQNQINCEATSEAVLAEVKRLLPKIKTVPYELILEIHIFAYRTGIHLENARVNLREQYNKDTQNATLCIASKIEALEQTEFVSQFETPRYINESIGQAYDKLVVITSHASSNSMDTLIGFVIQIAQQVEADQEENVQAISSVGTTASDTINTFLSAIQDLNVTLDCAFPDIDAVINSSAARAEKEFIQLVVILKRYYDRGTSDIDRIASELNAISLEVMGCSESSACGNLLEKIVSKQEEIPRQISNAKMSALVFMPQVVTVIRERGSRIIRDALDQLDADLVDLENCLQDSLL